MASFEIASRFNASPEAVWAYVSWEGMPRLTEGGFFTATEFPAGEEAVAGKLRKVYLPEGAPFVERLDEYLPDEHFYRYTLVDTGDLPITDYQGVVRVTPAGSGCCLKFGHDCTVVDGDEDTWWDLWSGIETQVFDYIRKAVE